MDMESHIFYNVLDDKVLSEWLLFQRINATSAHMS